MAYYVATNTIHYEDTAGKPAVVLARDLKLGNHGVFNDIGAVSAAELGAMGAIREAEPAEILAAGFSIVESEPEAAPAGKKPTKKELAEAERIAKQAEADAEADRQRVLKEQAEADAEAEAERIAREQGTAGADATTDESGETVTDLGV